MSASRAISRARRRSRRSCTRTRSFSGAIAGALAGCATTSVLHPVDTVKTQLQLQSLGSCSPDQGPVRCFLSLLATKGGVRTVYAGFRAAALGSMLSSALYFGAYEWAKATLPEGWHARMAISAVFGNAVSSLLLVPKEVIKQRLQAGATGGALRVAKMALEKDGWKGLYVGYGTTLLRNAPSNAINFSLFEWIKARRLERTGRSSLEPWESFLSGFASGGCASFLTTPLDVAKTRMMTRDVTSKIASVTPNGLLKTLCQVATEDGTVGLYRGSIPRAIHGASFGALGFLAFETFKRILLERCDDQEDDSPRATCALAPQPKKSCVG